MHDGMKQMMTFAVYRYMIVWKNENKKTYGIMEREREKEREREREREREGGKRENVLTEDFMWSSSNTSCHCESSVEASAGASLEFKKSIIKHTVSKCLIGFYVHFLLRNSTSTLHCTKVECRLIVRVFLKTWSNDTCNRQQKYVFHALALTMLKIVEVSDKYVLLDIEQHSFPYFPYPTSITFP